MILCISVLSVVISPFSFLVLLIWFFSFCFLMSLANVLSILFILRRMDTAFGFVDFCYGLFYIYFCPNFYDFIPSTNPGVLHFFLSSCFRYIFRLFIWLFSCFLLCLAMILPLGTASTVSHRFWVVVFYFHSFLCIFWFFKCLLDLFFIQSSIVQPPYVGIFNSFSPVIEI